MKIHILGICGTFMGSLAVLAKQLGHEVSGCDANVYPPMSTQLTEQGIELMEGYDPIHLQPHPDLVVVGNAMSRGNPCIEYMLNERLDYCSGPQWLSEHLLADRWVLAVAGTHGKTTTTAMLAWILQQAGLEPGYLIGGVPLGFARSASLGNTPFFVIEADEYDTAFFDKRSKFIHYHPRTLILNNLEFDHGDIFDSLKDIQRQFHHLLRIVPQQGRVIAPSDDEHLQEVLVQGCWSEQEQFCTQHTDALWAVELINSDGSAFDVLLAGKKQGTVRWSHMGQHNVSNALAAIAAARHVGVSPAHAIEGLNSFAGVKRRMELIFNNNAVSVYDDFAHHPTAINKTLSGLRQQVKDENIIAIIEPRSNTMRMGIHRDTLAASAEDADEVFWFQPPSMDWDLQSLLKCTQNKQHINSDLSQLVEQVVAVVNNAKPSHVVIMSNGDFGGVHQKLIAMLTKKNIK